MRSLKFTIRAFAVVIVSVTSIFLMVLCWRLANTLSGPGWCATAFGAGKVTGTEPIKGLDACVGLLTIQLQALSTTLHLGIGTIALCLGVLIIIVVAGARFKGDTPFGNMDVEPAAPVPVTVKQPADAPVPVKQEND